MCKVYHRNRKFRSTSQCVLLICSFNSAADMHSFSQSSQVFTLPDNAYFSCAHSTQRKICTFSHRNQSFSLYITMCNFDMLIQLSGRYAIIHTEITSFPPISLCLLFMCPFNSAELFPTEFSNFQSSSQRLYSTARQGGRGGGGAAAPPLVSRDCQCKAARAGSTVRWTGRQF